MSSPSTLLEKFLSPRQLNGLSLLTYKSATGLFKVFVCLMPKPWKLSSAEMLTNLFCTSWALTNKVSTKELSLTEEINQLQSTDSISTGCMMLHSLAVVTSSYQANTAVSKTWTLSDTISGSLSYQRHANRWVLTLVLGLTDVHSDHKSPFINGSDLSNALFKLSSSLMTISIISYYLYLFISHME